MFLFCILVDWLDLGKNLDCDYDFGYPFGLWFDCCHLGIWVLLAACKLGWAMLDSDFMIDDELIIKMYDGGLVLGILGKWVIVSLSFTLRFSSDCFWK